ncbi:uncharacterized protein LAJ45_00260 [Morchella importuna]|uniref:DUF7082 domain-containing protein n=1 Tax=Morchella conica CCBAS932 TaxID=1392247 RepID=A0A3N4L1B5_9PEZI|nr:uncharacterized protein LAJ45_00260 [Morchella importuna]KAH8155251.1 hypothetical protein LAJ45_00260 [Morchella importuna]RPB11775.1 hypothetical protein P167DRAFT_574970 [Morchella conica CCBAS932]
MSAYGKSPQQQPEYDTRPQSQHLPNPQSSYGSYTAQSHYTTPSQQQQLAHIPHSHSQSQQHTSAIGEATYPSRGYEEHQTGPLIPRVMGYTPQIGVEGTPFSVFLHCPTDLTADSRQFRFMFGSRRCNATIHKHEGSGMYRLSGETPAFALTGWVAPQVTVYMNMEDEEGQELGTVDVGTFTYTDATTQQSYSSPPRATKLKRKLTAEPEDSTTRSPAKRSTQPIRPKSEDYGYGYQPQGPGQYPPYASHAGTERAYGIYSGYDHPEQATHAPGYQPQTSPPRNYTYGSYSTDGLQQSATQPGQPWAQPYPVQSSGAQASAVPQSGRPIRNDGPPDQQPPSLPSPSNTPNPTLIRTSTLQQSTHTAPGAVQGGPSGTGSGFNPYGIYPHKALLEIQGELNDMAHNWTSEEWDNRRRLVQFWRRQKGSTIHTTFRPVAPNERQPNSICISCIWWAEKRECYVTSVDCIYLLESLIAVRFTVEEKNRIRRNLEGCKPLTVSKAKPDSENFFKLIMAFPNPKPRNIEKDVKVFPWAVLTHALKKIIGKYSASYSSTASVIPAVPGGSAYPGGPGESTKSGPSDAPPSRVPSPPSATDSKSSAGPSASITGTAGPPSLKQPPLTTSPPIQRTSGQDLQPHTALPPPSSQHGNMWHAQQPLAPPTTGQRNWDMAAYLEANPTANPAGAQVVHYSHGPITSEDREPVSGSGPPVQLPSDVNVP